MRKSKGITLIELLVVLTLSSLLLSSILYLFSTFISKSVGQEKLVASNTETQNILNYIKWDILMTGYALPSDRLPISVTNNTGYKSSDQMTLRSLLFRSEMETGAWSFLLSPATGSNTILVKRWDDPNVDFVIGDKIILLTPTRRQIGGVFTINDRTNAVGPKGEPAWLLTLDNTVFAAQVFAFSVADSNIVSEIEYKIQDGDLMRGSEVIAKNVENFQTSYWVDLNENLRQDAGEIYNNLDFLATQPTLAGRIKMIKIHLLVKSLGEKGYTYTADSLVIADNTLAFSADDMAYRRRLWETQMLPRNIK
ncbi:prepilin-type N-terminal cleavage/methylation domain-containing protein [bacterium]|nr:prepilin-type N-terminal cleavage/methylation domain-containing protein [bacterium]